MSDTLIFLSSDPLITRPSLPPYRMNRTNVHSDGALARQCSSHSIRPHPDGRVPSPFARTLTVVSHLLRPQPHHLRPRCRQQPKPDQPKRLSPRPSSPPPAWIHLATASSTASS